MVSPAKPTAKLCHDCNSPLDAPTLRERDKIGLTTEDVNTGFSEDLVHFRFLDLPLEIRRIVYQQLLDEDGSRSVMVYDGRMSFRGDQERPLWCLANTSRILYREALPYVYKGLSFSFRLNSYCGNSICPNYILRGIRFDLICKLSVSVLIDPSYVALLETLMTACNWGRHLASLSIKITWPGLLSPDGPDSEFDERRQRTYGFLEQAGMIMSLEDRKRSDTSDIQDMVFFHGARFLTEGHREDPPEEMPLVYPAVDRLVTTLWPRIDTQHRTALTFYGVPGVMAAAKRIIEIEQHRLELIGNQS